jgi:hypothetical protein
MTTQLTLFEAILVVEGEETKLCPGCGEVKPVSYFYRRKRNPDGYGYMCANCENPNRITTGPVARVDQPRRKKKPALPEGYRICMGKQDLKQEVIERDRFCRLCGNSRRLEIHHISSRIKDKQDPDYQTALCHQCHLLVHGAKE